MLTDLINTLSKENWDGICKTIETTGKAAGVILTGVAAVHAAKNLSSSKDSNQYIEDIEKMIDERIKVAQRNLC